MNQITQLYPNPNHERPLIGAYLGHDFRKDGQKNDKAFVYANFVTSLDGCIAIPHPNRSGVIVPKDVDNARDWRLFQELAVQADLIISAVATCVIGQLVRHRKSCRWMILNLPIRIQKQFLTNSHLKQI